MKVSLVWLKRFVDIDVSPKELAEAFVNLGFEVESMEKKGFSSQDFLVVGKILSFEKHPNADRLSVCKVDVGDGNIRQIVCGAKNFSQGDVVAVALPGAVLPGDFKIKKSNLRGVPSEGMMCSGHELGLGSDHSGILILNKDLKLGTKLHEIFNEQDAIYDLSLTANRGDALCHYGIARELGAWYNLKVKELGIPELKFTKERSLKLELLSKNCQFYSALMMDNIEVKESPDWMKRDLQSIGVSVINNVVDITNWIMLAYGQPLHAFNAKEIQNDTIVVRDASANEKIQALDGKEYLLPESAVMIADTEKALAIGGVIGGERSKVDTSTTRIVLESACFVPENIRKTSRNLQINTDSAYRYTRHVDSAQSEKFLKLAASMISNICGGLAVSEITKAGELVADFTSINLDPNFVRQVLGFDISDEEIFNILTRLQYIVHREGETWNVQSPSYRWDVVRPIDLVEECLRIYGVKKIPETVAVQPVIHEESSNAFLKMRKIAEFLAANGFWECYNYTLRGSVDGELMLENPLLADQTHVRSSLIPGLLDNLRLNNQNDNDFLRLFEVGRVVRKFDAKYHELFSVAFLIPTEELSVHWENFNTPSVFDAKKYMARLIEIALGEKSSMKYPALLEDANFEKNFSAKFGILGDTTFEAHVGFLKASVLKEFKMPIIAAEMFILAENLEKENSGKKFTPYDNFPSAKRDISLIVNRDISGQMLLEKVQKYAETLSCGIFSKIEVKIFDDFEGGALPEDQKSIGLQLAFKNETKTPSENEIDNVFSSLVSTLKQDPEVSFRG